MQLLCIARITETFNRSKQGRVRNALIEIPVGNSPGRVTLEEREVRVLSRSSCNRTATLLRGISLGRGIEGCKIRDLRASRVNRVSNRRGGREDLSEVHVILVVR
jgi:hypothetical protein